MCTLFSDVQIQAFKLGLDFITEHEKGFRRMLQSKLCALMEARENYLAIVWLCRIEKRELESKRVRERELVGDDNVFVLPSVRCMESIWHCVCAHIFLYIWHWYASNNYTCYIPILSLFACVYICTTRIESEHLHCQTIVCHVCLVQMPPSNCYCFHFTLHHQFVWHLKVKLQYKLYLHWMTCPYL